MDRPLEQRVLNRRRTRRIAAAGAGLVALVLVLALLPGWVRPSVRRSQIRTAVVGRGPLEATLTASGTIVPEREQVLSSPLDTRLLRVLVAPGSAVKRGDAIVLLDVSEARLALEKLDDQIALKSVEAQSESIVTRQSLADLEAQRGIRKLTVESGTITVERNQSMFEKGIATENELRASRTNLEAARLELKRIEDTVTYTQSASEARLRTLALERSILRKERDEASRQLELATARTDRDGVLTWALQEEGAAVRRGDVIARVADLSSFRVEARFSDVHGTVLAAGMPARIAIGDTILQGTVSRVLPEVENGTITLLVDLVQRAHPSLRANRQVDVHLVTARTAATLRFARGPIVHLRDHEAVFVVHGDAAICTPVRLGIASFDQQEVLEGLAAGDEVVISDMSDYEHVKEVRLR